MSHEENKGLKSAYFLVAFSGLTALSPICKISIANPHQVFPLSEVAFESQAFGSAKCRDERAFDLLSALAGAVASLSVVAARLVNIGQTGLARWIPARPKGVPAFAVPP